MKTKRLMATLLTLSLTASIALVGCGKKPVAAPETKPGDASAVKMDKDQFLNGYIQGEPKSLDPSIATDKYSTETLVNCMEGLTRIEQDKDGKDVIKPAGAEKWESNADKTVWTFHLRDFKWSDGKAVTAQDFEFAIKRALNPKTASTYAFILFPLKNAKAYNSKKAKAEEVGIKALDAKTLEFTLDKACPYFLDLTYFKVMYPQREDIVKASGEKFGTEANTMIYNGPFILKNWAHQSKMEFEKNPTYWDKGSVKLDKLTLSILKDETARMNSLSSGVIDYVLADKTEWVERFKASNKFDVSTINQPLESYTHFNQKNKYFKNAKIRQAFSLAVDREQLVKVIYKGLAQPAYGWCPPTLQIGGKDYREKVGVEPLKEFKAANPDAKKLLIEGLKEIGENPDPSKAVFSYLEAGTDAKHRETAEYNQEMYKKNLGINLKVEYVDWAIAQKRSDAFDYQMTGVAWNGDYNDPNTFFDLFMTGANQVATGWSNPKYDNLIKGAANTIDAEKRIEFFKQAEKILLVDDAVIAPTVYRVNNNFRAKYVKNVMSPLFGANDFKYSYTEGRK
ncbi:peptide ABC transporter substrate-binding protein [Clostridium tagluense]|uniref:peptide ABC transporter substrate-binding protein n=1 Tax=Clostridium tagluense TaxID=360422 RepID=UPI001C6F49C8|nr:peptide ABC transporter substrate-binding protein [Clostridium tagluense]MBW9156592.1 peptide ABC transporter substrate-binding protein [Clostridium tagluense]WLC64761.1 peptide ABC transporter substrate-binding protein [Clostridium tagluense]